jgi:hypothetical protein
VGVVTVELGRREMWRGCVKGDDRVNGRESRQSDIVVKGGWARDQGSTEICFVPSLTRV